MVALAAAGALPNPACRPGSLICHGDVIFQHPAPTSLEVLEALVLTVGPNKTLAGSDFQVEPYSLAVGGKLPSHRGVQATTCGPTTAAGAEPQPARAGPLVHGAGGAGEVCLDW